MSSAEARKLDILLDLKKKGYNLIDGDKPELMTMSLGGGYTLVCNVKKPTKEWRILFNDGVETTEYPADSEKIVHTYRGDADKLITEYDQSFGALENAVPEKKAGSDVKNTKVQNLPGMCLPIVYPSDMAGFVMHFKQWTAKNGVVPAESEVVILEDGDYNYRVSIPQARIRFEINKDKVEVVKV